MERHRHRRRLEVEQLELRTLLSVVSGVVFEDLNDNGEFDDSEPGRDGWEVLLFNTVGDLVQTTVTTNGGQYSFQDVDPGAYVVQEVLQPGWRQTFPHEAVIASQARHAVDDDHRQLDPDAHSDADDGARAPKTEASGDRDEAADLGGGPRSSDLLPDLTVDVENGLSDWYIDGNELRFSQATPNIGDGPLEMRGGAVQQDGTQQVVQRIRNRAGGSRDRTAGFFVFHPQHGHIHFDGYSVYNLRRALPDANGDGQPELGDIVATGGKISFCLLDSDVFDDSLPNFDPSGRYRNCGQTQGISVGWEDIYDASLEGQSIDLTNVLPGRYWLESIVDPDNHLLEKNESNNVGRVLITIPNTGRPGTYTIEVAAGQDKTDLDFGNFKYVIIRGQVYEDHDANGAQGAGDQGLPDRIVYLDRNNNGLFDEGQINVHSADVPKTVADESAVTSTLSVSGAGVIVDVNVKLNIDHTYDGDLRIFLVSPEGTRVELVHNRGGNGQDFDGTIFDDEGTQSIANGSAPFAGRFRPEDPLTAFDGEDADGLWTLEVKDTADGDVGTLKNWSLEITFDEPHVRTDAAGNFSFDRLGLGTHVVRLAVPPGWQQTTSHPDPFIATTSGDAFADVSFGLHNVPPQVVGVFVKPVGKPAVGIPVGSGVQLEPLVVGDIKRVILTFSEGVKIKRADLNLDHVQSFRYDPVTFTGTWILDRPLRPRPIELDLSDRLKDLTGLALDGEWDNPTDVNDAASDTFASGDGMAGGRFIFRFVVGQNGTTAQQADDAALAMLFADRARRPSS
jgi:subtilisin-like proprotein convertase family protein